MYTLFLGSVPDGRTITRAPLVEVAPVVATLLPPAEPSALDKLRQFLKESFVAGASGLEDGKLFLRREDFHR